MPLARGMQQQLVEEGVGEAPCTPGMQLRSAQKKRLLAAAADAAVRADSGVGSSQQLDRTDSCGGPRRSADAVAPQPSSLAGKRARKLAPAPQQTAVQQSRQQAQADESARAAAAAAPAEEPEQPPPAKRRRVARTGPPAALPAYELRTFDRPSPPYRQAAAEVPGAQQAWGGGSARGRGGGRGGGGAEACPPTAASPTQPPAHHSALATNLHCVQRR